MRRQLGGLLICLVLGSVAAAANWPNWRGPGYDGNRHAFSSSPVVAGGKIYVTREDGKTFVLDQGEAFKVLASNELEGESVVATPVLVDGRILIRTAERLYCFGK